MPTDDWNPSVWSAVKFGFGFAIGTTSFAVVSFILVVTVAGIVGQNLLGR